MGQAITCLPTISILLGLSSNTLLTSCVSTMRRPTSLRTGQRILPGSTDGGRPRQSISLNRGFTSSCHTKQPHELPERRHKEEEAMVSEFETQQMEPSIVDDSLG